MSRNWADRNDATERIDENIKRVFDDIAGQELPSDLTNLLQQLKKMDAAPSDHSASDTSDTS